MLGNILCFDPGDTTGIAEFDSHGALLGLHQVPLEGPTGLVKFLNGYEAPVMLVVYEDYIVFRKKAAAQTGSKMRVAQAIGAIKSFADQKEAPYVTQAPDIKAIALKWSQIKMPGSHSQSHQWDAYLHGYYWLVKNGVIQTKLQQEMAAKRQ